MFEPAFKNIDDVLGKEAGCTIELDYHRAKSGGDLCEYYTPRALIRAVVQVLL